MKLRSTPFLAAASVFLILISLGFWQLSRLNEKNAFVAQIRSQLNEPAAPLPQNFTTEASDVYKKYRLQGRFLADKSMFLYSSNPTHAERHGYFVMTPFALDSGRVILINRGWIPQSLRPTFLSEAAPRGSDTIEAMVMLPKTPSIFIPKNDLERNIWIYVDLKAMEDFAKAPMDQGFYMVLVSGEGLPKELIVRRAEEFLHIRNDHLWYAITWFSLAAAVMVIYYFRCGKSNCE